MKITSIESFTVKLADTMPDDHRITRLGITRIRTDEGITGYGFQGTDEATLANRVRPILIGANPLDIEQHWHTEALYRVAGVEHALWDIAGKAAGMPVRTLLGSTRERIPYYLTCVWAGAVDQSHVSIKDQADQLVRYYEMGHNRFKIRGWRPDPLDDVRVLAEVKNQLGDVEGLELMIDRTAHHPGWFWTYEQGLQVARAMESIGATWLEEPFAREDIESYRRLREEVDIPITGGEFGYEMHHFKEYLAAGAVDIIQPDGAHSGGIMTCRKVGTIAEAFDVSCILHGTMGPHLAASLQAAGAIASCRVMEVCIVRPPFTPQEMWEPVHKILKTDSLFTLKDGYIELPKGPGLGVDIDEEALEALDRKSVV